MKLEVGMYVRTKDGRIDKIKQINGTYRGVGETKEDDIIITYGNDEQYFRYIHRSNGYTDILKSSYNLIDLIQVGDYVNGIEVIETYTTERDNKRHKGVMIKDVVFEIKTVVTKEQFEVSAYKVEEIDL